MVANAHHRDRKDLGKVIGASGDTAVILPIDYSYKPKLVRKTVGINCVSSRTFQQYAASVVFFNQRLWL